MGKQKTARPTSPQVVATLSSLLLLLVSCALGFYFMELRGPGVRTLLSGSQASEVLVLLGGLAAIVLTGHLAVANAARSTQGTNAVRKLMRRAAEVDSSDPKVLEQFHAVPELRDLVAVLVAEKEQGRQLQDALESVRGEHQGLLAGMERSLGEGGKMRQDHPSELGRKVATLWNSLLERIEEIESAQDASPEPLSPAPGVDSLAMEDRIRELENRVSELHASMSSRSASSDRDALLITEDEMQQPESLLVADTQPDIVEVQDELDPFAPLLQEEGEPSATPSVSSVPSEEATSQVAEPVEPTPTVVDSAETVEELREVDPVEEGIENTFAPPKDDAAPRFAVPWREQSDAPVASPPAGVDSSAQDDDQAEAVEHTYSEWGGAGLRTPQPSTPVGPADPLPSAGPGRDASSMRFPEFATPNRKDTSDHVEVTYNGSTQMDEDEDFLAFDVPVQEAYVEDAPVLEDEDEVVDLKSLGARESNE